MHENKTRRKRRHRILTWKTHNGGKNHGNPQAAEYTIGEEYNVEETQRQRPLVLFFATRDGYNKEGTTSLSLTLYTTDFTTCNNNNII